MESTRLKIKNLEKRINVLEEYSILMRNNDPDLLIFIERLKKRKENLELELDQF